jgi:hypothetical protein
MELHLAWIRNEAEGYDLIAAECPDGGAFASDENLDWAEAGYSGTPKWLTIIVPEDAVEALFADDAEGD